MEVFRRPANLFVASFIGSTPMNLLPGRVQDGAVAVAGIELPAPGMAGGESVVRGVRPEYLDYSDTPVDGAFGGQVSVVEHLGGCSLVTLDVAGEPLHVVVGEERDPEPGEQGWALPRSGRVLLYRDGELVTEGGRSMAPLAKDGGHG